MHMYTHVSLCTCVLVYLGAPLWWEADDLNGIWDSNILRLGAEVTLLMVSRLGVLRITSMLEGRVPGFWRLRGLVCRLNKRDVS